MRLSSLVGLSLGCSFVLLAACSDTGEGETNAQTSLTTLGGDGDGDGDSDSDSDSNGVLDVMTGDTDGGDGMQDCGGIDPPDPNASLEGTVFAPNLEIPISGALVYLTDEDPEPVPDQVYCAECTVIPCDVHQTFTNADGTFSLPAIAGSGQKLVVQKGQFLRVVEIDVAEGTNQVPANQSNLPGEWNPANGMWIPRIAVYDTDPDAVYNVLAKFGLGTVSGAGTLQLGTERFDMISDTDQGAFMDDLNLMNQYHIVFVPCASTKYWIGAPNVPQNRIDNVRAFVEAGGKWYATDHSNEYVKEPFPNYQDFHSPGMPDIQPAYTSVGTVVDDGMLAWMEALPANLKDIGGGNPTLNQLPSIETRLNYSGIDAIHDVWVQNDDGEDVNVGHEVFVEGPCSSCTDPQTIKPMAVRGEYGCGRMMYSTFETSSVAHNGLNPQELALLYMILEIGTCHGEPPPPPPPVD